MSFLRYLHRLRRMDDLIRRKATGPPEEFARRLGLGRSALMDHLREMRELGAKISYCRARQSYYYKQPIRLVISFKEDERLGQEGEVRTIK